MPKTLYAVTALVDGNPVGAFIIAADNDEVAERASNRIGPGGKLTHIVPLCEATLGTLKRNGLLKFCSESEQIEFLASTLLEIITTLQNQVSMLKQAMGSIVGTLKQELGLKHFQFSAKDREGITQYHETFAPTFGMAFKAANELAQSLYGTRPDFISEVPQA